jgi:molecular chaperone GrpE
MEKRDLKDDIQNISEEAEVEKRSASAQKEEKEAAVDLEDAEQANRLKDELDSAKDKYIRLYSEFENFRKRTAKEKLELIQSANEQLITSLLPVADDFERAENAVANKNDENLAGFFLIRSKFMKVLDLYGVKAMDAGQGSEFNADLHEAISQVPAPVAELKGKIVDVIEKGYLLNDKVIRYAKVVVGN